MLRTAVYSARAARTAAQRAAFSGSARMLEASAFKMPAMSPTMTEGGIVDWKVKAGEPFSAGDVLLDIETDKAQISVEAQDDGVLAKILAGDGTKEIPVGKPIAVIVEPDEDISQIDFDAVVAAADTTSSSESNASSSKSEESQEDAPRTPEPEAQPTQPKPEPVQVSSTAKPGSILPSALRLLHENGYKEADAQQIKGTGPHGRILKGDVLAFLGKIDKAAPGSVRDSIKKLEHLDLSNVEVAPAKKTKTPEAKPVEQPKKWVTDIDVQARGLSIAAVKQALDRASRLALRDTLLSTGPKPSALRDPVLDALTAPKNKLGFSASHQVKMLRGAPRIAEVSVALAKPSKAIEARANEYIHRLEGYFALELEESTLVAESLNA